METCVLESELSLGVRRKCFPCGSRIPLAGNLFGEGLLLKRTPMEMQVSDACMCVIHMKFSLCCHSGLSPI